MKYLIVAMLIVLSGCDQENKPKPEHKSPEMKYLLKQINNPYGDNYYLIENIETGEKSFGYIEGYTP